MHAAVVHTFDAPPRYATFADPKRQKESCRLLLLLLAFTRSLKRWRMAPTTAVRENCRLCPEWTA